MNKLNNKSGFTLIEIIVVLIIVGILAAIALPNLFSNVTKSQGSAALASADSYKTVIESCLVRINAGAGATTTAGQCSMPDLGLTAVVGSMTIAVTENTGTAAGQNIAYNIDGNQTGAAADNPGHVFTLQRSSGGGWTCIHGTDAAYADIC